MLNILLIDDDLNSIENIFNGLYRFDFSYYKIVNITCSEKEMLKNLNQKNIDVIILNLDIKKENAYNLLNKINEKGMISRTITISTENDQNAMRLKYKYPKMFFDCKKPVDYKSLSIIINRMYSIIKYDRYAKTDLIKILDIFSFNTASVGYKYIVDCLEICINNNYQTVPFLYSICEEIAKLNNVPSPQTVNWDMQKSVKYMQLSTDSSILNRYFNFIPSTKIFLNKVLSIYYNMHK